MADWGAIVAAILGLLFILALVALVIVGIVLLVRSAARRQTMGTRGQADPLDIARRRLASGEITPEQFEEIRKRVQS
jgi:uncharacterized membrane protein